MLPADQLVLLVSQTCLNQVPSFSFHFCFPKNAVCKYQKRMNRKVLRMNLSCVQGQSSLDASRANPAWTPPATMQGLRPATSCWSRLLFLFCQGLEMESSSEFYLDPEIESKSDFSFHVREFCFFHPLPY
jgi:hypothetical protein